MAALLEPALLLTHGCLQEPEDLLLLSPCLSRAASRPAGRPAGELHGRGAAAVRGTRIRAAVEQRLDGRRAAVAHRAMQRRRAVLVPRVRIGAELEQASDRGP